MGKLGMHVLLGMQSVRLLRGSRGKARLQAALPPHTWGKLMGKRCDGTINTELGLKFCCFRL